MFITSVQTDELMTKIAELSGLDSELIEKCSDLIRSERYDEAVGRAFVILEEQLRELLGVRGGAGGHLVQKLFSPSDTQFTDRLRLPDAEVAGLRDLFIGAFKAFRNRAAHTVADYTLDEARAIIHLVNLLLLLLDKIQHASTLQVPSKIADALTAGAADRLHLFLENLQSIGVGQGQGKDWIPYRAILKCSAPSDQAPEPSSITIFYLVLLGEGPVLIFNSNLLSKVAGLEIKRFEEILLQAGCIRTAAKDTPIRLPLGERNDQVTFDRLYEILEELMKKHRA